MKVALTENFDSKPVAANKPSVEQLRNAAVQFEAILLMQITSAMSPSNNSDDEDSLFGSDAGSGLANKMFSEQMATTLAQSGGFGISDLILKQIGGTDNSAAGGIKGLAEVISSVRALKEKNGNAGDPAIRGLEPKLSSTTSSPAAANSAGSDEVQIISTFEDDLRANGIDEATRNLMLDGRVVNSTRARVVPGAPVVSLDSSDPSAAAPGIREVEFHKPLTGRISSEFGTRFHPLDRKMKFHGGIDIAVPTGTRVSAAAEGTVAFAGRKGGYGNVVIIEHPDGRETRYAHLASISVAAGDPVAGGQPIAFSGSTGKSTGPHLHFEMREHGRAVDPTRILSNVLTVSAEK